MTQLKGSQSVDAGQFWWLLLPNDNPLYSQQLNCIARELIALGHSAKVTRQCPSYLDLGQNLLSINLQGALDVKGLGNRISWIQDPAPGLALSREPGLLGTRFLFLGGAVADDCGFPDGGILLPGLNYRRDIRNWNRSDTLENHVAIVGNSFDIRAPDGTPVPALMDLILSMYPPLSGSLQVEGLLLNLLGQIPTTKRTTDEFRKFCTKRRELFAAQVLGVDALMASDTSVSRSEISALVYLAVNAPRVLDRRQLVATVLQAGLSAKFFGAGWESLGLNPLLIQGPVAHFPDSCPQIAEARLGIHTNTHGLMAHPTPMGFFKLGLPVISHESPLAHLAGGGAHFVLPGASLVAPESLENAWKSPPVVPDSASDEFMRLNSWRARATQLVSVSNDMVLERHA